MSDWDSFSNIVRKRRSVRGFSNEQISATKLEQIFTLAQQAPSNCNTQPWQVGVVSGAATDKMKQALVTAMGQGQFKMDFEYSGSYQGVYKDRQYGAAAALYQAMGIEREDKAGRGAAFNRNFEFFDAPHVAFLFLPADFAEREAADLGMYAQTLMLSLTAAGCASCAMTSLSFNADVVRQELGFDESYKLMFGISFGYEDEAVAANQAKVERAPLSQTTHFFN